MNDCFDNERVSFLVVPVTQHQDKDKYIDFLVKLNQALMIKQAINMHIFLLHPLHFISTITHKSTSREVLATYG